VASGGVFFCINCLAIEDKVQQMAKFWAEKWKLSVECLPGWLTFFSTINMLAA